MGEAKQRKTRRLAPVPEPTLPLGKLALALRDARAAHGLTQGQAAVVIGVSPSTVQRAESGKTLPEHHVVDSYVDKLGLNPDRAEHLRSMATNPVGRRRRTLTPAPAVRLVNTTEDLGNALRRAWEEADRPSMQMMERRAESVWQEAKDDYAFLSGSAANRIVNRRQLPTSVKQLRSYLHACRVQESQLRAWIAAYQRVKAREREEAMAKKQTDKEEQKLWLGWQGRQQVALFTSSAASCSRVWEALRSTVG
ncbi:helix-turn-helix transcriptional regulator [Streptomyces scopuliridis]|uniref:helix-turn-helix transcriptional regulator n=1 Tax=Streptomyces scopuliridis TaxID=452529 RepID=UPI00343A4FDD